MTGKFKSEHVKITRIEILKFWLDEENIQSDNSVKIVKDQTDIGFNIEKQLAKVVFEMSLAGKCDCAFKIGVTFEISNWNEVVEVDDQMNIINTEKNLYPHIFAITYSTIRGIVFTKTLGSHLQGLILPVLHPSRFYRKFLKEEKEKISDPGKL